MRILRVSLVLAAVAVLGSLLVVSIARARRQSRVSSCAGNLRGLWSLQVICANSGLVRPMPDATGADFWRALEKTHPPMVDESTRVVFQCRVKEDSLIGDVDYFGPGVPVHRLAPAEAVGCDDPRNHGGDGGNVLRKSGDVLEYASSDLEVLLKSPNAPRR